MLKRLVVSTITAGLLACCVSSIAEAREYTTPEGMKPNSYQLDENPDGTVTEYYENEAGELVRGDTYLGSVARYAEEIAREAAVESGTSGNVAGDVTGSTENSREVVDRLLHGGEVNGEKYPGLENEGPYATRGEAEVGNAIADDGVAEGVLPDLITTASATAGTVIAVGGTAALGVAIGTGIDELLGWPSFRGTFAETTEHESEERYSSHWIDGYELGKVKKCSELPEYVKASTGKCRLIGRAWQVERVSKSGSIIERQPATTGEYSTSVGNTGLVKHFPDCSEEWFTCLEAEVSTHTFDQENFQDFNTTPQKRLAYPQKGLKADNSNIIHDGSTEVPAQSTITPPIEKPAPHTFPEIVPIKIIEIGAPQIKPVEEGTPLPNPEWPEIPEQEDDELATVFKTRVETAGFTDVEIKTLPDSLIDTSVGPNDVAYTAPSEGSKQAPATKVIVEANPEDAPEPGEIGGTIGPPTLPGIKLPHLNLLCTTMPFGVPCWLVKQIEAFSGTGEAPVWSIGPIHWGGGTIPEAKIHLSAIEPIMEKIRPWMILFGTMGIVLFFYKVFTGHSISGGENPPGEVPEPERVGDNLDEYGEYGGWL